MNTETADNLTIKTEPCAGSELRSSAGLGHPTKSPDAYVGRKKCGCLVAVVFDDPRYTEDTANSVADFIKSGYRVENVVWSEVKDQLQRCRHPKPVA